MSRNLHLQSPAIMHLLGTCLATTARRIGRRGRIFLMSGAATLTLAASVFAAQLNILYYGNSFLSAPDPYASVPNLVAAIAAAAGHADSIVHDAKVDGANFSFHLEYNLGAITSALPPTEKWDVVVMQNFSTEATETLGDVELHTSSAVALYQAVAAHSPNVVPVLLETWARGPVSDLYSGPTPLYPSPNAMQAELRAAYAEAAAAIDALPGSHPKARIAPVGDAFENINWTNTNDEEGYHASPLGSMIEAVVLYQSIYNDSTSCDIDLYDILANLGIENDAELVSSVCDFVAVPEPSSLILMGGALAALAFRRATKPRRVGPTDSV